MNFRLPRLLAALGLPHGYAIGRRTKVYGLTPIETGLSFADHSYAIHRVPDRRAALEARILEILLDLGDRYQQHLTASLRRQLPRTTSARLRRLHHGPEFSVWLDGPERASLRRTIPPWTLTDGRVTCRFREVEVRVAIRLTDGAPRIGRVPKLNPHIVHPFVGPRSGICLNGFFPGEDHWADNALALMQRATEVLTMPSNPSGGGGYRSLASCAAAMEAA